MAKTFNPQSFFKSISRPIIFKEFITSLLLPDYFPPETADKKVIQDSLVSYFSSISHEERQTLVKELSVANGLTSKQVLSILKKYLLINDEDNYHIEDIGAMSGGDIAIYIIQNHSDKLNDIYLLSNIYESKGYLTYPVQNTLDLTYIDNKLVEFKNGVMETLEKTLGATKINIDYKVFDERLHMILSFEDKTRINPIFNDGFTRYGISAPVKEMFFVYHPDRQELDIKGSIPPLIRSAIIDKLYITMFEESFTTKEHKYSLALFESSNIKLDTDIPHSTLISWRMSSINIIIGQDKKQLKLTAPKGRSMHNDSYDIDNIKESFNIEDGSYTVSSVNISFVFASGKVGEPTVKINTLITDKKCSLGNFKKEERLAKQILTKSGVDLGFVDVVAVER